MTANKYYGRARHYRSKGPPDPACPKCAKGVGCAVHRSAKQEKWLKNFDEKQAALKTASEAAKSAPPADPAPAGEPAEPSPLVPPPPPAGGDGSHVPDPAPAPAADDAKRARGETRAPKPIDVDAASTAAQRAAEARAATEKRWAQCAKGAAWYCAKLDLGYQWAAAKGLPVPVTEVQWVLENVTHPATTAVLNKVLPDGPIELPMWAAVAAMLAPAGVLLGCAIVVKRREREAQGGAKQEETPAPSSEPANGETRTTAPASSTRQLPAPPAGAGDVW